MERKKFEAECRKVAAEGCVLLENDGTLPLNKDDRIALFGREQFEYVKSGSGSGGKVNCPYVTDLNAELKAAVGIDEDVEAFYKQFVADNPYDSGDGWKVPSVQKQPYLEETFVKEAAARCNKAVIVISRVYGESFDVIDEKGGWRLTDEEERTIELAAKHFSKVAVVVNSGNLIDFGWIKKYGVNAVMLIWQGGQEGAAGAADVLVGKVSPCGKLPMSIAALESYRNVPFGDEEKNVHAEDIYVGYRYLLTFCPEKILYPFGFGKSYAEFILSDARYEVCGDEIKTFVNVKNVGNYSGKEVVQIYFSAPQGKLGKAKRELIAFAKTKLLAPNEQTQVELSFKIADMRAFDDTGASGFAHSFVMEAGDYKLYVGTDSLRAEEAFVYSLAKTVCVEKLSDALRPNEDFVRLTPRGEQTVVGCKSDYTALPAEEIAYTGDKGYLLKDVADGKCSLNDFVAQFTAEELSYLVKGEGWGSPKTDIEGSASVFGGITKPFIEHGVPLIVACDGPSGVRTTESKHYTCIPSGVLLSSTWEPALSQAIFQGFAEEMKESGIDVILAPGVNIHRHPFGGRNFEYFSEDPLLAGRFADAIARYFSENGVYATIKHFAVNSQEKGREAENEVLSERALREIYLREFEIAVKGGGVRAIMTSYNRINGVSACANAELTDAILRCEWGFTGFVMSDWWAKADKAADGSFGCGNIAETVKAQNDIFMVVNDATKNNDDLLSALENGELSVGELQRSAKRILQFIMGTHTFKQGVFAVSSAQGEEGLDARLDSRNAFVASADGDYWVEISYTSGGSGLEQFSVPVFEDGEQAYLLTAKGTDGKAGIARLKCRLKSGRKLVVGDQIEVCAVRLIKA